MAGRGRTGFLKPKEDEDNQTFREDRPDIEPLSQTSYIYDANPGQVNNHQL